MVDGAADMNFINMIWILRLPSFLKDKPGRWMNLKQDPYGQMLKIQFYLRLTKRGIRIFRLLSGDGEWNIKTILLPGLNGQRRVMTRPITHLFPGWLIRTI